MQLTRYTDYSLRVLIFLSLKEDSQRVTISHIAEYFNIPRNHLVKVVHQLGLHHYIQTTRGKSGGLKLARATNDITIGDVVRDMEKTLEVINCGPPSPCPINGQCQLKFILNKAANAFLEILDQYTIADLQQNADQLKFLLNLHQLPEKVIQSV